jgi:hypothetical protein
MAATRRGLRDAAVKQTRLVLALRGGRSLWALQASTR